jgi:pimeloyl-ACP methyl ester carboxylesterase
MFQGHEYWKNYMIKWFGSELIDKWKEHVTLDNINSNNSKINLEVYDTGNKNATTIVFAHGIAGYARILLPFTIPLFEKGYNLVIPDLQGYGYNSGIKGDFEWNAHKQNLKDTVDYAINRFSGKIVLGGASMGGPLAYAAACEHEAIDGLACWCLWDFNDREFMLKETNTKRFTYLLIPIFKLISKIFGKLKIKTYKLISYDTLTDSTEFNNLVKNDPQAGTTITLLGATSLVLQSMPKTKHEDFNKPVIILQPEEDEMTPKYYTQKVFDKLNTTKKYVEVKGAPHFPTDIASYQTWANEVDSFIRSTII